MITLDGISLPADLEWIDEYEWNGVAQTLARSLTGAVIVQEAAKVKGRPITLAGDRDSAWIRRAELEQLRVLAQTADAQMVLDYHGDVKTVMFRRDTAPISARLIVPFRAPQADDYYSLTVRLFEV